MLSLGRGVAPVGLDISGNTFRIAQLKPSADKPVLINYASLKAPLGLINEGEISDIDGVAKALAAFWRQQRISEKKVVVGVANQKVIVRVVEMPYMTETDLRSAIQFQANDYIPIPMEEAIVDFQIISEHENNEDEKVMDVLIVAVRKDMVENLITAVEGAGLKPVIIDVSSLAFARTVMGNGVKPIIEELPDYPGATALINVGSNLTDIVVIEEEVPRFTRISSVGGDTFTEALIDQLGVSLEDAEALKIGIGLPAVEGSEGDEDVLEVDIAPDMQQYVEVVNNILEQEMVKFIAEIRRSLDYYLVQATKAKGIDKVVVSGGGAKLRNFLRHLKENLQIEAELAHPLHSVQVSKKLNGTDIDSEELSMAICIGLAMRGIEK